MEISLEEKKAIESFKDDLRRVKNKLILCKQGLEDLSTILNLIEKQQETIASKDKEIKLLKEMHNEHIEKIENQLKEIEELKQIKNGIKLLQTNRVNADTYYVIAKEDFLHGSYKNLLDDYIPKQKIKDKIEELENIKLCADKFFEWQTENKIKLLKELLEEE